MMSRNEKIAGHPMGLFMLFFTEMWERFSYYGMRVLFVLYLTAELSNGGLGWDRERASMLYGWYTGLVYITPILGGFLADKLLGYKRSIVLGGLLMTLGHVVLAVDAIPAFYLGCLLLIAGNGFFKPNISSMVGQLYQNGSELKDSAYTIFYMGINVGAFLGILLCGYIGESIGWHFGFGLAGIFMFLGLVQFWFFRNYFAEPEKVLKSDQIIKHPENPVSAAVERDRLIVIAVFSFFTIFFWLAFEQAGSSMSLYARDYTDRSLEAGWGLNLFRILNTLITLIPLGVLVWLLLNMIKRAGGSYPLAVATMGLSVLLIWALALWMLSRQFTATSLEIPASWFQTLNSLFIVLLAPVFSKIWAKMSGGPSGPVKFAIGLLLVSIGFAALVFGSSAIPAGASSAKVSLIWICLAFLFHTMGELCVSPVGLSYISKLSPKKYVSMMFGIWFCAAAIANYLGGFIASFMDKIAAQSSLSMFFSIFVIASAVAAIVLLGLKGFLIKRMHNIL
ncbi:peptide MFS transporter [Desertivirga brevis]|uniref:peptide MFS transporter n=1 Tax=Desertivirga brevis TaxID=2810310 RepID=UPI001A97D003|nr:peptide MFS transporter [Pedobacter sp. SYSU D00873]